MFILQRCSLLPHSRDSREELIASYNKDLIAKSHPDTSPIYFYHRGKPLFECASIPTLILATLFSFVPRFTNFSLHSVEYGGKIYATAEHRDLQALKFMTTNPALAEVIRTQPSARAARKEAGFQRAHQRQDWFDVNVEAMDTVLYEKFTQHRDLQEKLLSTGNRELVEDSPDDIFWGIGRDGQGRNELGKALMRLRGRLRAVH
ncbi:hypothetical protein B0F90DRAFT_1629754 [Multifurca ochricompacta]|uniref:NADAR domain-containing protein n=1 Tax=Multifurca ochricompacta TaxID=376703 RepID=A0AAD4QN81_9AGAM|nr:hypothetical protein B0F90DRAFT_1629754 [Multifurca ochricompacta]